VTGAIAMSFGSLKPAPPLSASTPTTVNSVPLIVICLPIGSVFANSALAALLPRMTTRRPSLTSSVVNAEPRAIESLDAGR
jgi:hypothetical protein